MIITIKSSPPHHFFSSSFFKKYFLKFSIHFYKWLPGIHITFMAVWVYCTLGYFIAYDSVRIDSQTIPRPLSHWIYLHWHPCEGFPSFADSHLTPDLSPFASPLVFPLRMYTVSFQQSYSHQHPERCLTNRCAHWKDVSRTQEQTQLPKFNCYHWVHKANIWSGITVTSFY